METKSPLEIARLSHFSGRLLDVILQQHIDLKLLTQSLDQETLNLTDVLRLCLFEPLKITLLQSILECLQAPPTSEWDLILEQFQTDAQKCYVVKLLVSNCLHQQLLPFCDLQRVLQTFKKDKFKLRALSHLRKFGLLHPLVVLGALEHVVNRFRCLYCVDIPLQGSQFIFILNHFQPSRLFVKAVKRLRSILLRRGHGLSAEAFITIVHSFVGAKRLQVLKLLLPCVENVPWSLEERDQVLKMGPEALMIVQCLRPQLLPCLVYVNHYLWEITRCRVGQHMKFQVGPWTSVIVKRLDHKTVQVHGSASDMVRIAPYNQIRHKVTRQAGDLAGVSWCLGNSIEGECKGCKQQRALAVFTPCGHTEHCASCAQHLLKCPTCEQDGLLVYESRD